MAAGHSGGQSNQGERHDARPGQEAYAWNDADTAQGLIYPAIPPMRQWGPANPLLYCARSRARNKVNRPCQICDRGAGPERALRASTKER